MGYFWPAFTYLLQANNGDLNGFYADCKVLAAMEKDQRKTELAKLLQKGGVPDGEQQLARE